MTQREPLCDDTTGSGDRDAEVLIVGAGISGIGAGIELLKRGQTSFILLEAAQDLGGTWRDNTYPGVAVDIPISSYCFSFEPDFSWSRAFAPGREVQAYVRHCADKFGVTDHVRYGSRVERAVFDAERDRWEVRLQSGGRVTSKFLIAATGLFSTPVEPDIPGLDQFTGTTMHSARWNHDHDFTGRRAGIIGTGASAVQIVPELAARAGALTVFQRTPIYVAPRLDFALRPDAARRFAPVRRGFRLASELAIEALTFMAVNYRRFPFLVHSVQRLIRRWMLRQVTDRATAEKLLPDYDFGCKRPVISNTYLSSFNRNNVTLVTDAIERVTAEGVICRDGTLHALDTLVLATGFRTTEKGNAPTFEVVGRDGQELGAFWDAHRLQSYAGIAVAGFPNFFLTAGPYSGGLNWYAMLETHLGQIMQCLEEAKALGATRVEVKPVAYEKFVRQMWQRAEGTVFKAGNCETARSYYIDRHGDAALPSPRTPMWRARRARKTGSSDFSFGSAPSRRRT